jgi:tetratricopeptide (TPR) repeat protein
MAKLSVKPVRSQPETEEFSTKLAHKQAGFSFLPYTYIMKIAKKSWKEIRNQTFLSIFFCGIIVCILISYFWMAAGNLFFGNFPSLYNLNLAEFFYTNAAYPLLGKSAPYAHYQLSRTYFITGNLTASILEIQKELELYPTHTRAYYILGLTYGYLNQEQKAIQAFSKFIEENPTSWAARNDKAWLQFRIGNISQALETIEPVAHDTSNPWVQNTYGTLLMNTGRYAEAKQAFTYALKNVDTMSIDDWGMAYPGNDPRIYNIGLNAMKSSIQNNLALVEEKSKNK